MDIKKLLPGGFRIFAGKNPLENARKTNCRAGRIAVTAAILMAITCHFSHGKSPTKEKIPGSPANSQELHLKYRMVPLSDPVYTLIDYLESRGLTDSYSMVRPYNRETIVAMLEASVNSKNVSAKEKKIIETFLLDYTTATRGFEFLQSATENSFLLAGLGAEGGLRTGVGKDGSLSYSALIKPFIAGDLGDHITFGGSVGMGGEKISGDIFFQSYTKDRQVVFPSDAFAYSWLPYQFRYNSDWIHYKGGWSSPFSESVQIALSSQMEFNTSWLGGNLQVNLNNQNRSWGHSANNLLLSGAARSFPGLELKIRHSTWFRFSMLTGSLYFNPMDHGPYLQGVYGVDLGRAQKMLSCQMLEIVPTPWLQLTAAGNAIWGKRMEMAYLTPFFLPSLVQDNLGDHDNPSLYFDAAFRLGKLGKVWIGMYMDDFSLIDTWQMLRMPTNKYAWQAGWKTDVLSGFIPATLATLSYTRLTPMVYTHYPEDDYTMGNNRPTDMTYTHDGFNLGHYLPPNSAEYAVKIENLAIPDLVLTLDSKMILHGTNDLDSKDPYTIYGDVYRYQLGPDMYKYPLLNFTKDGIYDYTVSTELKFDWKVRCTKNLNYFRVIGSIGGAWTRWESNNSGVIAPQNRNFLTGSLGISVDI